MPKPTTRVNIKTTVNADAIRKETRNGREVIVVPSATLPDDVVMNGIKYPADEIEKGFATLADTLAPLGHPTADGMFVEARQDSGIKIGYAGVNTANVRP